MTIDTYVFPFSSINDNDDVFRKDTRIIDIPDVSEQECSMSNTFQQFAYSDHGVCDYDRLIDPVNNLYNNILVNCKYYDNFQFNVLSKKKILDYLLYISMHAVLMLILTTLRIFCAH